MIIKTNVQSMADLCKRLNIECQYLDETHDTEFLVIEGKAVLEMVDFANSVKGKMLFSMLGK